MTGVILDGYTINPGDLNWNPVTTILPCDVYDRTDDSMVAERIGDADAVFCSKSKITSEVMDSCPNLKYIGVLATGYNNIDLFAAKRRGITVTNIPAYSTDPVAQFTFALLLELCHHTSHHAEAVLTERGRGNPDFCFWDFPQIELSGKTIGLIGYGAIGRKVGEIASAIGLKVLAFTPRSIPGTRDGSVCFASLDTLLCNSDIVSMHCPLTSDNEKIVNAEFLNKMKVGAFFLNTARGGLVDEEALADALNSGKLAGAGVDVVAAEPVREETCPLLHAKNCIVTPHIAWATQAARERLISIAGENFRCWMAGTPSNTIV